MRVLGVDPGTVTCGWGVVECRGTQLVHVCSGAIAAAAAGRRDISLRLAFVYSSLLEVMDEHHPDELALERNFVARNVQSAFRLGEARGVAMAAAAARGIRLSEYTPMMVKKSVVGYGRADKQQVQLAVQRLLGLGEVPATDTADALAAALCHGLSGSFEAKVQARLGEGLGPRAASRIRARSWRTVRG